MEQTRRIDHFNARWRRICLNTYWLVLVLSCIGTGLNILFVPVGDVNRQDPQLFVIVTIVQVLVIIAAELTIRYLQQYFIEIMIILGAILSATLCAINETPAILFILVQPILLPTFLGRHNKILFSLITALLTYFLLLVFDEDVQRWATPNDVIIHVSFMVSFAFLTYGVYMRGRELLDALLSSIQEKQEIERIAKLDALTGLSNHRSFHEHVDQHLEARRHSPYPLYLLLLDLDSFKKVNDTFGHLVGDTALRYVAGVLQDELKEHAAAFRYGGEEFAVLISHHSQSEVLQIANQIREEIAKKAHPEMAGGRLTVSIGISQYRAGVNKEGVFAEADACLYEAKRTGKNKVILHQDSTLLQHAT